MSGHCLIFTPVQGPCSPGFMVTWNEYREEAACSPALCGEGSVMWEVGALW